MIGWMRGVIVAKDFDGVVLDVGGVGYELAFSLRDLERMPTVGEALTAHVHTNVREDAILLFGFLDAGARRLFRELTSISGIGPRLALNALSVYDPEELRQIILSGDLNRLTRISGVGKKTAQRVVLELGEKLRGIDIDGAASPADLSHAALRDLTSALENLGYPARTVAGAVDTLAPKAHEGAPLEALLKEALALLRS